MDTTFSAHCNPSQCHATEGRGPQVRYEKFNGDLNRGRSETAEGHGQQLQTPNTNYLGSGTEAMETSPPLGDLESGGRVAYPSDSQEFKF